LLAARRLSDFAEQHRLLPDTQIGNRRNRSTEAVLELLVEQIYTVWSSKEYIVSVLLLDITGIFDKVNYLRLLDNLQKKQVLLWFIYTVQSFLTDRSTTFVVDSIETPPCRLPAGVLQGLLLLPILFLFYNTLLLEVLNLPEQYILLLGFADNINLLVYRKSTAQNCTVLESVYKQYLAWAGIYRIQFLPSKYLLVYFTCRYNFDLTMPVQLGEVTVSPKIYIQILRIQLDTKLNWKTQTETVSTKIKTQIFVLSCTTVSTWGATIKIVY
jgi:hypothetical protein